MISDLHKKEKSRRRRVIVVLQIACVMITAFYYFSITGSVFPLAISGALLLVPLFKNVELKTMTRPLVYSFVMAMVLSVIPYQLFRQNQMVFALLPATLIVPMLIISAAHVVLFEHRAWIVCCFCGLIFCCYLVGADIVISPNQPWHANKNQSYHTLIKLYYVCLISVLAMLLSIIRLQSRSRFTLMRKNYKYRFLQTFFLLVAGITCFFIAPKAQSLSVPALKGMEHFFASALQKMHYNSSKKNASNESDINRPFHRANNNLGEIIMRVRGDNDPSLLRFYSYDEYEHGVWKRDATKVSSIKSEDRENTELLVTENYILDNKVNAEGKVESMILPTSYLDAKIIPIAYDTGGLTLSVDSLDRMGDGALVAKNFSRSTGIVLKRSGDEENLISYPNRLPKEHKYLQVPESLKLFLIEKGNTLFGVTNNPFEASQLLTDYFSNEYEYSLDYAGYDGEDPIVNFLQGDQKAGHCELFATSTIMLLRSAGFPSRYATGSVCVERAPNNEYTICRNVHLHAWVEVWDKKSKTWFVVDPTPGTSGALPSFEPEGLSAMMESLEYRFQSILSFVLQGEITEALAEFFFAIITPLKEYFSVTKNVVYTMFLVTFFLVWMILRRVRANRKRPKDFSHQFIKMQMTVGLLMKRMGRHSKQIQGTNMTLADLRKQLKLVFGEEESQACCTIIDSYQNWRFGSGPPLDAEIQQARSELRSHMKRLKI